MQINDGVKLYLKFGSPVALEYEAEDLTGEYMFGADTDCDLQTACCVAAAATAADGKLVFHPGMDNQTFYDKVHRDGKIAGFWEIRSTANRQCIAAGVVIFEPAVTVPGYTPAPEPRAEYYNRQEVDNMVASADGVAESRVREIIDEAVGDAIDDILSGVNNE